MNAQAPKQCRVQFCVATDHDGGTRHIDYQGIPYTSCVHGNLTEWDPCRHCGHGSTSDPFGIMLDALTREYHTWADSEQALIAKQSDAQSDPKYASLRARLMTLLFAIGTAVAVRRGQDSTLGTVATNIGRTYVESAPRPE